MILKGAIAKNEAGTPGSAHYAYGSNKAPRLWIVMADRQAAHIFSRVGSTATLIGEAFPSENGKTDVTQAVVFPGVPIEVPYEPSMKAARRKAFKFSRELAIWLDEALRQEAFDRLILIAPPQTLGDLRDALSKAVYSRLLAEINRDLSRLEEKDLNEGLGKIA